MKEEKKLTRQWIAGIAVLTAVIFALQIILRIMHLAPLDALITLVPVVVGTIIYDNIVSVWLGFVFGLSILICDTAEPFIAANLFDAGLSFMIIGMATALGARGVYMLFERKNETVATYAAAFTAPAIKNGVFLIISRILFMQVFLSMTGNSLDNVKMSKKFVAWTFLVETIINVLLVPIIVLIIKKCKKKNDVNENDSL